jgi:plastocyanin
MRLEQSVAPAIGARIRAPLLATAPVAVLTAAAITAAGCFSEPAPPTTPASGVECRVPAEAAGATLVAIRAFAFHPAEVRIKRGTRVAWVNCDAAGGDAHTSTSDAGAWDSPFLASGAAFARAFDATGSFTYHCEPHPAMRGTVVVED